MAKVRAMTAPDYQARAAAAIGALQRWYVPRTGLWKSTGWWNAANALTAVIRYSQHTGDGGHAPVLATTFRRARRGHPDFVNTFFDDNGWWGLAWVAAYDLAGEGAYLDAARTIFARNLAGWDGVCGGGLWWNTKRTYKNAITNELFITLAAQLHERTPGDREYLSWALRGWEWLTGRALIGPGGLVNDGLTADCANNGGTAWTYNQGVILGGLAALYEITGDRDYLRHGEFIADAALTRADRRRRHPDGAVRAHRRRLQRRRDPVQGHLRPLPARVLRRTAASAPTGTSCSPTRTRSGIARGTAMASSGCAGAARSTTPTPAGSRRRLRSLPPPRR